MTPKNPKSYAETPILKVRPANPGTTKGETPIPKIRPASKKS